MEVRIDSSKIFMKLIPCFMRKSIQNIVSCLQIRVNLRRRQTLNRVQGRLLGLTMQIKKSVAREVAQRYQKARKTERGRILDEFVALTGYCRTYASWLLRNCGRKIVIDRLLRPERKKLELKSKARTKPGTLLKHQTCLPCRYRQVPIRTFSEWDDKRPGFSCLCGARRQVEMDLVGHDWRKYQRRLCSNSEGYGYNYYLGGG